MDFSNLTIQKFNAGLVSREFSAVEAVNTFFNRIKEKDKEINAYLRLEEEKALLQAAGIDAAIVDGGEVSPLAGVPLAIKDNILIEGGTTTAASKILENYEAAYDATIIKKLKKVQAVFLGKTNLDEFAMGSSTENSAYQITKNPYNLKRVPGGSSGGSAAAVAADLALAALGSDTGGSVRQPAAFCGVVGLKPTYGAVSRHGLMALASSLDQIGPITKTVEDAAILFKAIAGRDDFDSTSADPPAGGYGDELLNPDLGKIKNLKIGLPKEYFVAGIEAGVKVGVEEAIGRLKSLKMEFKEVSLPHTKYAVSCYYIILPAEVSTNLARYDGLRYARVSSLAPDLNLRDLYFKDKGAGFGQESRRRILLGTFVLSAGYYDAYYAKAQKVRRLISQDFEKAFKEVDVILTPVTPTTAFKIGEKANDPLAMYLSDIFTIPANLAGLPAISIPVKNYSLPGGELPVGFQLIGRHFREADILGLGQFYEKL